MNTKVKTLIMTMIFLCVFFIFCATTIIAYAEETYRDENRNTYYYTISNNNEITITSFSIFNPGIALTIPEYIEGLPVTSISSRAFSYCYGINAVTIPDTVKRIGDSAFTSCPNIRSLIVGNGVTDIGSGAFSGCSGLTTVSIGKGLCNIGSGIFSGCSSLKELTMPKATYGSGAASRFGYIFGYTKDSTPSSSISPPSGATYQGYWTESYSLQKYYFYYYYIPATLEKVTITTGPNISEKAFYNCKNVKEFVLGQGITNIGKSAFRSSSELTKVTIPYSVSTIDDYAFNGCSKLTEVYYNGAADKWNAITIGAYNEKLNNAAKHYFVYVTLLDKDENKIMSTTPNINACIDTSSVVVPEGYNIVLYTDKELTKIYDVNTPIAENLTLYVDFINIKLNVIEFKGTATVDIGEKGITQSVSFATDKTAKYFSCTLKVPNGLEVQEIKSDIFEIEQDSEVIGNDTYYYLFLIYNGAENIPTCQTLNAFEVVFDVSENAVADEILTIEILDDAILADNDGNSYEFTSIGKSEIKINPILAEEITIIGDDEIDTPTQYTASILPENTTTSNVEWSVSDETIATISETGLLTPVKNGTVTIRATAQDESGIYAEKTVSVKVLGTVNSIATNIGLWDKEYSANTTNYIIYVPKTTTLIRLTAKHDGVFKTDEITFFNNVARTVTLSTTSDETVLDLTYTCEGYDDNKYTITIIKFKGAKTEVSEDKKSFTITPINVENGKTVILALYNGEQFVEMQSTTYQGEAIPFTTTKSYTKAKVMVWDDLTTLKPVCNVEIVK